MGNQLDEVTIRGFKSIRKLESLELKSLNVMIGANGAGKSNFIDLFRLLRAMMKLSLPGLINSNLVSYIRNGGGIDSFLFGGAKTTEVIEIEVSFGSNAYRFKLKPTAGGEDVSIEDEERYYERGTSGWWHMGGGYTDPRLLKEKDEPGAVGQKSVAYYIYNAIDSWRIYHFHDTSRRSGMRRYEIVEDDSFFRFDAANIAPFLLRLREEEEDTYKEIVSAVRLVTPFFDDFLLKPRKRGEKKEINLSWRQKGSDYPMQPYHFSDGTLRFACLATALLQPDPPSTIIIDEPELGLHPYAIEILAELVKAAATRTQVILSTQSPPLVDSFDPEDIITVYREKGASKFKRLNSSEFSQWLENYALGELWRKNVIAGGPSHE